MAAELPVLAVRSALVEALREGPVVLSAPTGSGKSTQVPRWCAGPVLVVEPRRIACRSLAARVAELEGSALGDAVGYVVRDERVCGANTRIVFVTPGIALRERTLLGAARSLIIDEFHERSLEVDLLLSLLQRERRGGLCVMSATLEAERVAQYLGGVHLTAEGRAFPVEVRYLPGRSLLPDASDLQGRVQQALRSAAQDPGDVLVFLPGKAEIEACAQSVRGGFLVVPLHGGLSLQEQRRAFEPSRQRKLILATNVAETSLTIPGIGVVIDAGLVRRTRYHEGRSYLTLGPIADDSAGQRAGRAGRTAPGVCYRLWSVAAQLGAVTPPEIHRESLVPLVLAAAAWKTTPEALAWLDAPKPYALDAARAELRAWGALDGESALSAAGRSLFALPIDPRHGRLLLEARQHGCLDDMIDLLAVLSVGRPLRSSSEAAGDDPVSASGCDAILAIAALRARDPAQYGVSALVLREAELARTRLRRIEGLASGVPVPHPVDRDALVRAALAADPRLSHVARPRGKELFFSNGGSELQLARQSAASRLPKLEAVIALDTQAFGAGRDARVLITCAMPIPLLALARAGLGSDRIGAVRVEAGKVVASVERVYAQRVIGVREETPNGALARAALLELLLRGSVFRDAVATTRLRLSRAALARQLEPRGSRVAPGACPATPDLPAWLRARLESLGVESGDDLGMLSAADFLAPELPADVLAALDREYPATVSVGDATFRAEYDLERKQVMLHMAKGSRREPPSLAFLPKFPGLRICISGPRGMSVVRERG